jgi:S1-C subfamily serine protease
MKRVVFLVGLVLTWLLPATAGIAQGPAPPGSPVVQLIAVREGRGGRLIPRWMGSGAIISADGLVLTNCHVALPRAVWDDPAFDYDLLVMALTVRRNAAPQPLYVAEVVRCDAALDLAVVKVGQTLDGRDVEPARLDLPVLPLGRPEQLQVGDSLQVVGYRGGAGVTLTTVEATVVRLPRGRQAGWIELDTEVEGGFSGGPVLNAAGELVGVLAVGPVENAGDVAHCRYTDDTGGDGILSLDDDCAAGGAIVTARPVSLADALLRVAGYGAAVEPMATLRPRRQEPTATPQPQRRAPTATPAPPRGHLYHGRGGQGRQLPAAQAAAARGKL